MSATMLAFISAFALVLAVELPDKTLVATVVLTTRYRPAPVLAGVSAAFLLQCLIAVVAGRALTLLPHRLVAALVAGLFATGAVLLLRGEPDEEKIDARAERSGWGQAAASFGVLFAAEWGDASQLATAALTARYDDPVAVFVGAYVALVAVAVLAVTVGQVLTRRIPLHLLRRVAGLLFAIFAAIAVAELVRG